MQIIQSLLKIIENPYAKKGYTDFKNDLEKSGRSKEASAIDYLIEKKFGKKINNISSDQEQ
jgi:hypothetical protein